MELEEDQQVSVLSFSKKLTALKLKQSSKNEKGCARRLSSGDLCTFAKKMFRSGGGLNETASSSFHLHSDV